MVEIRYGNQYEVTDLAGCTVSDARAKFADEFGIPGRAHAKLNGSKVKHEDDVVINDDDKLSFAVSRSRGAYLIGAMLLALVVSGSVFAYGFINGSTTLSNVTLADANFADVTVNATGVAAISWSGYGHYKGAISGPVTIFSINTTASNYSGDLVVTVSLGNADQLAKVYRVLQLKLDMTDHTGATMDINESGAADGNDWVMLTLDNGSVSMFPASDTGNVSSVNVKSGFFITHVHPSGGWSGSAQPDLFCEVAQR